MIKTVTPLLILALFSLFINDRASSETTPQTAEALFPESILKDFLSWNPVLAGEGSFKSEGHRGQLVRVFFNETASPTYKEEAPLVFAPGSLIAKAVIDSPSTPNQKAKRVYFMRKMPAGYDSQNKDWAYGFADLKDGRYTFSPQQGRVKSCIGCHSEEAQWDYVRTVEYFRRGQGPE